MIMRKLIIAVLVLISLDSFAQPTNYTWYKQRIRQYSLMLDSMLYIPRYNGTPSGVRTNENSAIDGAIAVDTANGRQYFYYNGSWRRLANYSELGVDSIWREAGKDSIFYSKAGNTYKIKDSTGGGSSTSPAGNFGNLQINRNGAFATPGSDSLDFESATGLSVKGNITGSNKLIIGSTTAPAVSQVYVTGGVFGGNIDARGDSVSAQKDEANIEVQHADYDGVSRTGYGVAIQSNGNVSVGSLLGYNIKNSGQLRFTNETNVIRVITNRSLRFGVNNIEKAVLDSNGRLGIGLKFPISWLQVEDSSGSIATGTFNANESRSGNIVEVNQARVNKFAFHTDGSIKMADQTVAPSTPSSGYGALYSRADSLRFKNDAGTEFTLGISGGGGGSGTVNTGTDKRVAYYSGTGTTVDDAAGFEIGNTNNRVYIQCQSTTEVPLIIQSVSSQTADMFQLKNSSGTVTASVYADGSRFGFGQAALGVDGVVQILNKFGMANSLTWTDGATSGGYIRVSGSMSLIGTSNGSDFGFVYNGSEKARVNSVGVKMNGRFAGLQGADVASANNLSLGADGNTFEITGTTQINLISNTNWQNGSEVTLLLASGITIKHGQATSGSNITISLSGAADLVTTSETSLTLVLSEVGGTQKWRQKGAAISY